MNNQFQFKGFTAQVRSDANGADVAYIDIMGMIGFDIIKWIDDEPQNTAEEMRKRLNEISASKIIVSINSLGGDMIDGFVIHDMLAEHPAEVETRVYGFTASAATIIAQAGDDGKRMISDNALYLVHSAKLGLMAFLDDEDAMMIAEDLAKFNDRAAKLYAKRSDHDERAFLDLMSKNKKRGKWLDGDEAKEWGLVDAVFEPFEPDNVQNVSADMFTAMGIPKPDADSFKIGGGLQNAQEQIKAMRRIWPEKFEDSSEKIDTRSKSEPAGSWTISATDSNIFNGNNDVLADSNEDDQDELLKQRKRSRILTILKLKDNE